MNKETAAMPSASTAFPLDRVFRLGAMREVGAPLIAALDDDELVMLRQVADTELARRAERDPRRRPAFQTLAPAHSLARAFGTVQAILRNRRTQLAHRAPALDLSLEVTADDITAFYGSSPIAITHDIGDALRAVDERLSVIVPRSVRLQAAE